MLNGARGLAKADIQLTTAQVHVSSKGEREVPKGGMLKQRMRKLKGKKSSKPWQAKPNLEIRKKRKPQREEFGRVPRISLWLLV